MWYLLPIYVYFFCFIRSIKGDGDDPDIRVAPGHISRKSSTVRVSAISNRSLALESDIFQYTDRFKYRWTDKVLNAGIMEVHAGSVSSFTVSGREYNFYVPAEGEGVVGTIIADPCFNNEYLNWCTFGDQLNTLERTPALLNAINAHDDTHYWGILGDNFYDQNGEPSATFFSKLSMDTKTKFFVSVPGNHDYWLR